MEQVTARLRFREILAELAEKAKTRLPESTSRIDKAVALVLAGDVEGQNDDGSWRVGSCVDPLVTHRVQGTSCSCDDSQYGRAPGGYCKHALAVMLTMRVQRVLESETPAPTRGAAPMLPEAPVSANVYVEIGGRKVQVTIRGVDEAEVLARVATVIARYPDAPAPSASPPTDGSWCAVHQLTMGLNQKNGQSWYSHRLSDGTFCKGKLKGA